MNDPSNSPPVEPGPVEAPVRTSVWTRMLNVLAYPTDAFAEVKGAPVTHSNWLAPGLCVLLTTFVYLNVIYSQPALLQQARDARTKAVEEQVSKGKLTQAQADQAIQQTERFFTPTFFKLIGTFGACFSTVVSLVVIALEVWLIARWALSAPISYAKAVEVCGLAMTIWALAAMVSTFLALIQGSLFAGPSLALFVRDFDITNKVHLVLNAVNVMTFWYLGVLSLGLAVVAGASMAKSASWIFGLWLAVKAASIVWFGGKF